MNTLARYGAHGINAVIMFLVIPHIAQASTLEYYGLQSLSAQGLHIVGLISLAIGVSYDRFAVEHYAKQDFDAMNGILSAGFMLSLFSASLTLICTVVIVVFAGSLFPILSNGELLRAARFVFIIGGIATAIHIVAGPWKSPVFIRQRFYLSSLGDLIATVVSTGGIILLLHATSPSGGIVTIASITIPFIVLWVFLSAGGRIGSELFVVIPLARRALPQLKISLRKLTSSKQVKTLIRFGGLTVIVQAGYMLYYGVDSIIISWLDELGKGAIAIYNFAQRWDPQIRMAITGLVGMLVPVMTSDWSTGNSKRLQSTQVRATRYCLIIGLGPCLILGVLAHPFFANWFDPARFAHQEFSLQEILVCVPIVRVILLALVLSIPGIVAIETLLACARLKGAAITLIIGGIANVFLSIALVKSTNLNLLGIAVASCVTLSAAFLLVMPALACRATKLSPLRLATEGCLRPLLGGLVMIIFCGIMLRVWQPTSLPMMIVQLVVCAVFYAIPVWFISLNRSDRTKITQAGLSLRKKLKTISENSV